MSLHDGIHTNLWEALANDSEALASVRSIFDSLDHDKSGSISAANLSSTLGTILPNSWTMEKINGLISQYDANDDGELDFQEFLAWATKGLGAKQARTVTTRRDFIKDKLNAGLSYQAASQMFDLADADGSGKLQGTEEHFLSLIALADARDMTYIFKKDHIEGKTMQDERRKRENLVRLFMRWDRDGTGEISLEELGIVLKEVNPNFLDDEIRTLIRHMDRDGNGIIDFREFIQWITGTPFLARTWMVEELGYAVAFHRIIAEECREKHKQTVFECKLHADTLTWAELVGQNVTCHTINAGTNLVCESCDRRHAWACHFCGCVCFGDRCLNDCDTTTYSWTCLAGTCQKRRCLCKKTKKHWNGEETGDLAKLSPIVFLNTLKELGQFVCRELRTGPVRPTTAP